MMMFGQTRIFFVMSRDGLLPEGLSKMHPTFKTPHVVTIITGMFVAIWRRCSRSGSWPTSPTRARCSPFHGVDRGDGPAQDRPEPPSSVPHPAIMVTAPIAILGCIYLFFNLGMPTKLMFIGWAAVGLVVYFGYSRSRSHVGRGVVEVHETDSDAPPQPVPPIE
jgi:APA family basic amino acid/polyamine antiporter